MVGSEIEPTVQIRNREMHERHEKFFLWCCEPLVLRRGNLQDGKDGGFKVRTHPTQPKQSET